jgi:hypothetical protein
MQMSCRWPHNDIFDDLVMSVLLKEPRLLVVESSFLLLSMRWKAHQAAVN